MSNVYEDFIKIQQDFGDLKKPPLIYKQNPAYLQKYLKMLGFLSTIYFL